MRIHLIAVGAKMPAWVQAGYEEYAKRFTNECRLHLLEIEAAKRGKKPDVTKILHEEGIKIINAISPNSHVIALAVQGQNWNTLQLSQQLQKWQLNGQDINLLIGGPDGLAPACLNKAQEKWSLSALTFPHPLVRIILAEQLYRAWSLLRGHPYHRE